MKRPLQTSGGVLKLDCLLLRGWQRPLAVDPQFLVDVQPEASGGSKRAQFPLPVQWTASPTVRREMS